MSDVKLSAVLRTDFGKGAARRTRREGRIPAVLYGHGSDPLHVSLPTHETYLALVRHKNALFEIDVEGDVKLAIVRDVQVEPVRREIEHIDLLLVKKGEKVVVEVPVVVVGAPVPATMHVVEQLSVQVEAEATNLPDSIEVDITGLAAGTVVYGKDLVLGEGASLVTEGDTDIVIISEVRGAESSDSAEEAVEA
ncbi:50S ribosomal protein L25/general stress protein Ctc [Sanguibacter sp. HDW7]|uniref:50S ribosomal protein L25/general stress protein Ctc n=1 Tax=Sanguibacter sp. HDW7 TaxID=2714931 RepID=UPI00140B979F|nr:50S ribosomal protein L25/general stress protein Ctc [Sanguibacter sp. HDW7]QIK84203.1 50S ribosomal protein L25/general stress protein Ctc [Sanguibacter sp. HDW7]